MGAHYRLTSDDHTVNVKTNGDEWIAEVIKHENGPDSIPWEVCYRRFPLNKSNPWLSVLNVTRELRREFKISGTYTPQEGE